MLGRILRRVLARLWPVRDDEASTDRRFVPSTLDESVRYAHGSGDTETRRELRDVTEQAERLDEHRRS